MLDDVVLDIGCGDGRVLVAVAKVLGCRGIGVDVSQVNDGCSLRPRVSDDDPNPKYVTFGMLPYRA